MVSFLIWQGDMGQTGSTQTGKHGKELSKSDSTLDFDPGLKSKLAVSPSKETGVKSGKSLPLFTIGRSITIVTLCYAWLCMCVRNEWMQL